MSDFVMIWLFIAVLLFWSMGAYNRLVRLRFQGIAAFTVLESQLGQYVVIVKAYSPVTTIPIPPLNGHQGDNTTLQAWAALTAAADQFVASLKMAHAKPLNGFTMHALRTALATLILCWIRLRDLPPDPANVFISSPVLLQWEHVAIQVEAARTDFNLQVSNYNEAIAQFPAFLLAWIFGFKSAQPI